MIHSKSCKSIIIEFSALLMLCTVLFVACIIYAEAATEDNKAATILFTHDMHSHVYPAEDSEGNEYGGYTRLYTLIKQQRNKYSADSSVITVDAGDFSMGTLFQVIYVTDACELRLLGDMGYDVVTLGNHEFDYRDSGLASMLEVAMASKDKLPVIVNGNYYPPKEGSKEYTEDSARVWEAFEDYGVREYTMLERDGVRYAVFGIFGNDSHEFAPMSGMLHEDPIEAAKRIVEDIKEKEDYDYIICLSHSGTDKKESKSEDHELAKSVDGIDVIISGHTHTTLEEAVVVNDTIIVSAGEYTKYLGVLQLEKDEDNRTVLENYKLLPIDDTHEEDKVILSHAIKYETKIYNRYLSEFGLKYDQVIAYSDFSFAGISDKQEELPLGNLISDSYIYAVEQAEGEEYVPVDFALVGKGVIRDTFNKGDITVADVFNVLSLGVGPDERSGYPLISIYIKGSELKNVFEIDATVTTIMPEAQLYAAGMSWTYNTKRILFNKVTEGWQITADGKRQDIDDDKLYRVVTGLYEGQILGVVNEKTYGILTLTPLDENGKEVVDVETRIVYDNEGNEVKAWYALASYLGSFEEKDGVSQVPAKYAGTEGRKIVYSSFNPIELIKSPNWITITVMVVVFVLICVIVLCVVHHKKKKRRHRRKRY